MNSIVKNSMYKLILNVFNLGIPLIIGPYAMRILGPTSMGNIYYSETIYNYFLILSSFGLYQYGIRELSRVRNDKKKIRDLFSSLLIISVLATSATLVLYYCMLFLKFRYNTQFSLLLLYSINIIFNSVFVEWAVEANEDYRFISIKTIIIKSIYVVLMIMFVKNPNDSLKYVLLYVFSISINNLVSYLYIRKKIGLSFKNIKILKHIKPLIMVVLMANINTLFTQLDRLALGVFASEESVSYYVLPQSISGTINSLLLSFSSVLVPRLSYEFSNKGMVAYKCLLGKTMKEFLYLLLPVVIGLYVISDKAILIYGGNQYIKSISSMKIFSIYLFTIATEYIFSNQIMYIYRKEKKLTQFIGVAGFCNLIMKSILIIMGKLAPTTAIFTTLISNFILITLEYIYATRSLKIQLEIFNKDIVQLAIILSISFYSVNYIVNNLVSNIYISTIMVIIICSMIYIFTCLKRRTYIIRILKKIIFKNKIEKIGTRN